MCLLVHICVCNVHYSCDRACPWWLHRASIPSSFIPVCHRYALRYQGLSAFDEFVTTAEKFYLTNLLSGSDRALSLARVCLSDWTITFGLNDLCRGYLARWFTLTLSRWVWRSRLIVRIHYYGMKNFHFQLWMHVIRILLMYITMWHIVGCLSSSLMPSLLWRCWLGSRKGIPPVKSQWWGTGVIICLEQGANDLHMVQLMPLPPHHLSLQ